MTARKHHLRYVALCGVLLLLLVVIAWAAGPEVRLLGKSLGIAPFALAGTFFFNRFQRGHKASDGRANELEAMPAEADARLSNAVYLFTAMLGFACVAVALLAPRYLVAVAWVVPFLAGSAGIHLEAIS